MLVADARTQLERTPSALLAEACDARDAALAEVEVLRGEWEREHEMWHKKQDEVERLKLEGSAAAVREMRLLAEVKKLQEGILEDAEFSLAEEARLNAEVKRLKAEREEATCTHPACPGSCAGCR